MVRAQELRALVEEAGEAESVDERYIVFPIYLIF
jgi:hypothetical protein